MKFLLASHISAGSLAIIAGFIAILALKGAFTKWYLRRTTTFIQPAPVRRSA